MALVLGLGHAGVSLYWLLGGTALLGTVGGGLEEWGRERSVGALLLLAAVTVVKGVVALLGAVLAGLWPTRRLHRVARVVRSRGARAIGWTAALVLVVYGGILTAVGVAVDIGLVSVTADDPTALRWHAYFWDPWFLLWGIALGGALAGSRQPSGSR